MEIKIKHNIPFIIIINARMKVSTSANVLQHNEYMVKSKVGKMYFYLNNGYGVDMIKVQNKEPNPTPNHYSFCRQEGHALMENDV
jgi:hypothetical protein